MTRTQAINALRFAGYHDDSKDFVRLYVENRIAYSKAREAFAEGRKAKENGMLCNCPDCRVHSGG